MRVPKTIIQLGFTFLLYLQLSRAECPIIKSSQKVQEYDKYEVKGFLQIPQTNILLINTVSPIFGVSIVYYNDMSALAGDIISVVKPDYSIIEMAYVSQLDQILIINSAKILLTNPYSLIAQKELSIQRSQSLRLVKNTMYAIVTMWYNVINILDVFTMKIVKILSNLNKPNTSNFLQLYSEMYTLSNGVQIIMCTNSFGVFSWSIDFSSLQLIAEYNDYIPAILQFPNSNRFRMFEKHPKADIFFFNGNSTQLIVVKIINLQERLYDKLYDKMIFGDLEFNSSDDFTGNTFTMTYQEIQVGEITSPMLIIGERSFYYKLPFETDGTTIQFPTIENNDVSVVETYNFNQRFYLLEGNLKFALACLYYVTIVDLTKEDTPLTYLYYVNDGYSRRTMYEELEEEFLVLPLKKSIAYSWISNVGDYFISKSRPKFSANISTIKNSLSRVKLCKDCLFLRLGDQENDIAYTMLIYPFDSIGQEIDIQQKLFGLKWENINVNLDPYYFKGEVWVALSFPYQSYTPEDYLCLLFNVSTGSYIKLVGDPIDTNWIGTSTAFALISVEDLSNQEIIAIDNNGNIYIWNLLTNEYKTTKKIENCTSPEIGSIFHYKKRKWIVTACEDFGVRIYDFETDQTSQLTELVLYSMPIALNAYSDPGIIVVSDFNIGDVHIYKFDPTSINFKFFITLFKGKFKDQIIGIELIQSNRTLWIQYMLSNLFFELGACIEDSSSCMTCTQTTYFNTNESIDTNQLYGIGTALNPFKGSNNYFTAMLKAQMYKDLIAVAKEIKLIIRVDSTHPIVLRQELLNNDMSSIVSLHILSGELGTGDPVQLSVSDTLSFKNYFSVYLINVILDYQRTTTSRSCGLQFVSVSERVNLEKIVISQDDCFRIVANSTWIDIIDLDIINRNFTNSGPIIEMNDSSKLGITNLKIQEVTFGKSSSIVSSNNQLILTMKNIIIQKCDCPSEDVQPNQDSMLSISMFTAGLIQVYELEIIDNIFCKKNIFTTTTSLINYYYDFEFFDLIIKRNVFQAVSESVFYSSQYYQRVLPWHSVTFRRATFERNSLIDVENDENDLKLTHMIMLNKIGTITFDEVQILNQDGISLFFSQYSYQIYLNRIVIQNDEAQQTDQLTGSSFNLYEFKELEIKRLSISHKYAIDSPLILAQNNEAKDTKIIIQNCTFSNLLLVQNQNNLNASPIMIQSPYQIDILLDLIIFEDNELNGLKNSFIYSTTAVWITNYVGIVKIKNCTFRRSKSNSLFNYIYVASNDVLITNSFFSEQSFNEIDRNSQVNGGCINLSTINVEINDCIFEKSFSEIGAFIMINSYGSELYIRMSRTSFKEGYALSDGGAIYINLSSSILFMICSELIFENIYTFNDSASVIAFAPQIKDLSQYHTFTFEGGSIKNWFGVGDNQFIKFQGFNFTMNNIQDITSNSYYSTSKAYQYYLEQDFHSQGSLVQAKSSLINIQFSSIHDLAYQVDFSELALLLSASNSTVILIDFLMADSKFNQAGIEILNGNLIISRSYFNNLICQSLVASDDVRILEISESDNSNLIKEPSSLQSSFIVLHNSTLKINETTVFNNIDCSLDCNGSSIQLLNSSFQIIDTQTNNSFSTFGGAIFIDSIKGDSFIVNSSFEFNTAKYTGGAIYFQAITSNVFKFELTNSKFNNNTAVLGRGGGIFARSEIEGSQLQSIVLNGCDILFNTAKVGASLDIQDIIPIIDSSTVIRGNTAFLFGNNMITYPTHLKIRNLDYFLSQVNATSSSGDIQNNDVDLVINNVQSGSRLPSLEFALVSEFDEEILPSSYQEQIDYSITVKFNLNTLNKQRYSIRGTETVYFTNSGFHFNDLELIGIPESSAILEFSSYQVLTLDTLSNKYVNSYTFKLLVNFRSCLPGEETNSYSEFIECSTCDKSYFSFDLQTCQNCRNGAQCLGGAQMITNPGYWRKGIYSDEILLCQNLENNCVGGEFGNSICYEGHIGALCEECDIYGEFWDGNYAKSGKYSCVNCSDIELNFFFVILLTCWTLISMSIAIKGGIEYLEHQAAAQILFSTGISRKVERPTFSNNKNSGRLISIGNPSSINLKTKDQIEQFKLPIQVNSMKGQEDKSGVYIKMLTNYIQIVSSIATFNLSIPSGIIDLPSQVGEPLHSTLNSLDCALKDIQRTIPIIYLRLIFSQIIPCFYMLLFIIILLMKHFLMKQKGKFQTYIISTGFIFLVIYVQPDLVAQTIALISCREIGGTKYILSNVAFECYTDDYNSYTTALVVPLLLFWVLILPGFLFSMLKQNKDKLSNIKVKLRYGFLYREYKLDAFYWEFIKMAEKIAIILALNFYSQSIVTKGILVFLVITVYGVIALIKQPFEEDIINQIDVSSTNICAITVLLGIFIYKNDFDYFVYLAFVVITLINVWYFLSMIKKIASIFLQKFNEPISKLLVLLAKRCPYLEKCIEKIPQKKIPNKKIQIKMQLIVRKFIKLNPMQKKELVHKLFLEELSKFSSHFYLYNYSNLKQNLDLKYRDCQVPNFQLEEDKFFYQDQIQIGLTSNNIRQLQTQFQSEQDEEYVCNHIPISMPNSPNEGIKQNVNQLQNIFSQSAHIENEDSQKKPLKDNQINKQFKDTHSDIQNQSKIDLILFDHQSDYESENQYQNTQK